MDKYRRIATEVIEAFGKDGEKQACENYRNLLKAVNAPMAAFQLSNADLVASAKNFLQSLPTHLRD